MQVVPRGLKPMTEYESSVSPKGQVTIPLAVRRRWGIGPKDKVTFRVAEGTVQLVPSPSPLEESFGAVLPLPRSLSVEEMTAIAAEEHAQEAAREGLDG